MARRAMLSSAGVVQPHASSQLKLCWWEGGREGKLKLGWGQGGQRRQGSTVQLKSQDSQSFITGKMRAIAEGFNKNIFISTSREILLLSFMEDSYLTPVFIYRNGVLAGFHLSCSSFLLFFFFFLQNSALLFGAFAGTRLLG